MQNIQKDLPDFATEDEERAFWATHDSTEFIDWDKAEAVVLPHLKPTTKSISLRLPESMLNQLRMLANKRGGVLNVASTAAFQPGPLMANYYASKAYVLSFSEALWEEARGTGDPAPEGFVSRVDIGLPSSYGGVCGETILRTPSAAHPPGR